MNQSDTEALKALVELARKIAEPSFGLRTHIERKLEDSLPALERMLASQGAEGSSVCPICGKDSPHYHPPEVVTKHYDRMRAITDQHILCVRLADALRGMPFPPHMPDEAGNAMRGALDEFDEKSAAYLQAALSAPPLAEPDVEAMAKEFAEAIDFTAGRPEARDVFRELFLKHLRPTQQTEGEWVRVPREPTEEMRTAAVNVGYEGDMDQFRGDWAAMLSAAPQAEGD